MLHVLKGRCCSRFPTLWSEITAPTLEEKGNIEMVKVLIGNNESILWESQETVHPNTTDDLTIHTHSQPAPAPKR